MIILKELKSNIRKTSLLFISTIFSIMLCFMVLASNRIIENNHELEYSKNLKYYFDNPKMNLEKIDKILNNEKIDLLEIIYDFPKEFNTDRDYKSEVKIYYDLILTNTPQQMTQKGIIPHLSQNEDIIAVPVVYALANNLDVGDKMTISGIDLEIVGFTDIASKESFFTTTQVIEKLNLSPKIARISPVKDLKDTEVRSLVEEIIKEVDTKSAHESIKFFKSTDEKAKNLIIILILLSILSLMFIYTHILNMRRKKYFIYRFNGMNSIQFYAILLFEILVIYSISFFISLGLFYILDSIILKGTFGILRYDLKFSSIRLVFITYLIIYIGAMFFNIRRYFHTSLVESYKEAK